MNIISEFKKLGIKDNMTYTAKQNKNLNYKVFNEAEINIMENLLINTFNVANIQWIDAPSYMTENGCGVCRSIIISDELIIDNIDQNKDKTLYVYTLVTTPLYNKKTSNADYKVLSDRIRGVTYPILCYDEEYNPFYEFRIRYNPTQIQTISDNNLEHQIEFKNEMKTSVIKLINNFNDYSCPSEFDIILRFFIK